MRFLPLRVRRLGLPRRAVSQILLTQLAIAAGVLVLATGLFLAPLSHQLDDQAMRRALAIAQSAAADPALAAGLLASGPPPTAPSRPRPSGSAARPEPSTSSSST